MKAKSIAAGACAAMIIAAAAWFSWSNSDKGTGVSLTFQRYEGNWAFLQLTNASDKSYYLQNQPSMPVMFSGTNGDAIDAIIDRYLFQQRNHQQQTVTLDCDFTDLTPTGRIFWSQWPTQMVRSNVYSELAPHAGISVQVPIPPEGLRRKVAAPYYSFNLGWRTSKFWSTPAGSYVMMKLAVILTKSQFMKLMAPQPALLKTWCDTELTNHCSL
jgi:hypothetical protein